ncbi:hypothetical protein NDI47_01730 [Microcoleus vaginatus GB1-A2]|uniref:hypothetical protein n=1 Tax=Microcoleus vaginatus TaxID=119532 RepID=UPI001683CF00|nr:hypothetical protein [Microcoleus sp. FACHB-61]
MSLRASHWQMPLRSRTRVRNDLVTVDRPLSDPPLLLVRSALLDPKNDIIY